MQQSNKIKPINWLKIGEVSFWGTIIWGGLRLLLFFFLFTPYGVRVFSRPFLGIVGENSMTGIGIGAVILFGLMIAATAAYSLLFAQIKRWWLGLAYGGALFLLFGLLFRMGMWDMDTISTELVWFVSLGLFIGMSLTAERFDEE